MIDPAQKSRPDTMPDADRVVTLALLEAARRLALPRALLARTIGVSAASAFRLSRGRLVRAASKEGELALLVIRVFRSLDALVGGDEEAARRWLWSENHHLGGVPGELVAKVSGLVRVAEYLDAFRGKM